MASERMLLTRRGRISPDRKRSRDRAAPERERRRESEVVIRILVPKGHPGALLFAAVPLSGLFD
jgi:hypothetical protein